MDAAVDENGEEVGDVAADENGEEIGNRADMQRMKRFDYAGGRPGV